MHRLEADFCANTPNIAYPVFKTAPEFAALFARSAGSVVPVIQKLQQPIVRQLSEGHAQFQSICLPTHRQTPPR